MDVFNPLCDLRLSQSRIVLLVLADNLRRESERNPYRLGRAFEERVEVGLAADRPRGRRMLGSGVEDSLDSSAQEKSISDTELATCDCFVGSE